MENRITTVFLDMDGTLVKHNYYPLQIPDEYLLGTDQLLIQLADKEKFYCVLTTGRGESECKDILERFKKDFGFVFDNHLYLLPTGIRVLVNDSKNLVNKAQGYCLPRDKGPIDIIKQFND